MLSNPNRYSNFYKSNITGGIIVLSGRILLIKRNRYIDIRMSGGGIVIPFTYFLL